MLAAPFLLRIAGEMVEALNLHCDVTVIDRDFDFDEVCDVVQPDFVLFDVVKWPMPFRPQITNPRAHPAIPRALVLNVDPHEPLRPLIFETLDDYGIDTIFDRATMCREHMPELAAKTCFSVPQFVDRAIFHDYGLEKSVPISIFSGHMCPGFYPWRAKVTAEMQHIFPTLIYPHPGYRTQERSPFAVEGEAYARAINRSHFSVADTTRLDYVVRKHIEIPASGSILVAPSSAALADYGFVDLENCILGSGSELHDKIDAVSRDPERQERIRLAGLTLAQSRYTREAWRVIPDWFECHNRLQPGEIIQQAGLFGSFRAVAPAPALSSIGRGVTIRDNPMTLVLRAGRDAILTGRGIGEADAALADAAAWAGHIAEPFFLQGVIHLLRGDAVTGAIMIGRRAEKLKEIMGDVTYAVLDPVEVAWLMLAAYLLDHEPLGQAMREQASMMEHLALRRMSWLLQIPDPTSALSDRQIDHRLPGDRLSTHWLGQENFVDWKALVHRVLLANGKTDLTARLLSATVLPQREASAA